MKQEKAIIKEAVISQNTHTHTSSSPLKVVYWTNSGSSTMYKNVHCIWQVGILIFQVPRLSELQETELIWKLFEFIHVHGLFFIYVSN